VKDARAVCENMDMNLSYFYNLKLPIEIKPNLTNLISCALNYMVMLGIFKPWELFFRFTTATVDCGCNSFFGKVLLGICI
jgi:hypothetical protein